MSQIDSHNARLGEALAGVRYPPSVVDKARSGYWSDFKTPIAFPKMDLAAMLARDGHDDLRQRVISGEFDG
jgi:hypothetical protein